MDEVLYEVRDNVAVLTLNRPDRLNALSVGMHDRLVELWDEVKSDRRIRAIVLTGTGRGFCTGMDLQEVTSNGGFPEDRWAKEPISSTSATDARSAQKITAMNNDIWLPTIVAINGVCAGGGLHFVGDVDYVLAVEDAEFIDTHVSVGQISALEPIKLMPRIGLAGVLALSVLGRAGRVSADVALRIGLVNEIARGDLMERAIEIAVAASKNSPTSVESTKRAIWAAVEHPREEAMQLGWEMEVAHRAHPDALEGPRAFAEKREPQWSDAPTPAAAIQM